ncbi:MAG: hypothetical protein Q9181_006255 [Wetmoreana brouardii]
MDAVDPASGSPDLEIIKILLDYGADYTIEKSNHAFLNHRNGKGNTATFDAAAIDRERIISLLLAEGADLTITNRHNATALHAACSGGYKDVVTQLLASASRHLDTEGFTAFLNHRNDKGRTALHDATKTNSSSIVEILLEHVADWTVGDRKDFTALHYCV